MDTKTSCFKLSVSMLCVFGIQTASINNNTLGWSRPAQRGEGVFPESYVNFPSTQKMCCGSNDLIYHSLESK